MRFRFLSQVLFIASLKALRFSIIKALEHQVSKLITYASRSHRSLLEIAFAQNSKSKLSSTKNEFEFAKKNNKKSDIYNVIIKLVRNIVKEKVKRFELYENRIVI